MLILENISKRFNKDTAILDNVSCRINVGERVGLVGPNGAGKSTLLSIIIGSLEPDAGNIHFKKGSRLGYLRQETDFVCDPETPLLDYCLQNFDEINVLESKIHELEKKATTPLEENELTAVLDEIGTLQHQYELLGGYNLKHELEKCLCGLGFKVHDFQKPFSTFSGGWKMRAELARILVSLPDLLLLDEPTNYLDTEAVEWLREFLKRFEGTLLLVSHDRFLLNALTNNTVVIMHGQLRKFKGNYDEYIKKYEKEVESLEATRKNQDKKKEQLERFVTRFKAKANKASQARSRQKQLDKMEEVTIQDFRMRPSKITITEPPRCGHELIRLENVAKSYDGERFIYRNLNISIENGEKLAFIGWNGVGKTTLLRMINGTLDVTDGSRKVGSNVTIGYHSQDYVETMASDLTVWETVRSRAGTMGDNQVRSILGSFRFSGDSINKTVSVLSGGEKVRLSFCRMLVNPPNLLILDEPTAHLDIGTRQSLEDALKNFKGAICLVSHDVDFLKSISENVIEVLPNNLVRYYGDYDYYRQKKRENEQAEEIVEEVKEIETTKSRKEQRRLDSERRKEMNKIKRPLEKKISAVEEEIEQLDEEQGALWQQLTVESDPEKMKEMNKRLSQIKDLLNKANDLWEELSLELEELLESLQ